MAASCSACGCACMDQEIVLDCLATADHHRPRGGERHRDPRQPDLAPACAHRNQPQQDHAHRPEHQRHLRAVGGRRGGLRAPRQPADQGRGADRPRAGAGAATPRRPSASPASPCRHKSARRGRLPRTRLAVAPAGSAAGAAGLSPGAARPRRPRPAARRARARRTRPGSSRMSADFLAPGIGLDAQELVEALGCDIQAAACPGPAGAAGSRSAVSCAWARPAQRSSIHAARAGCRRSPARGTCRPRSGGTS